MSLIRIVSRMMATPQFGDELMKELHHDEEDLGDDAEHAEPDDLLRVGRRP